VLEGGLALGLEGDDDKADKNVDHEKGDDDDVNEVEESHHRPDRSNIIISIEYRVVAN
jgi:hypothetical protein